MTRAMNVHGEVAWLVMAETEKATVKQMKEKDTVMAKPKSQPVSSHFSQLFI
jgi:hypothetical protein